MKLKYERFEGLGCLYVRGPVDDRFGKLLQVGVETIAKDLEETLVVNLMHAQIAPSQIPVLTEFKARVAETTKHKLYWITKEKGLTDFPTLDVLLSRMTGAKSRQIGERIKADDEAFLLTSQIQALQARITQLGGDEDNVIKLIMENASLQEQKRILDSVLKFQAARSKLQVAEPVREQDSTKRIDEGLELIKTYYGREIDL